MRYSGQAATERRAGILQLYTDGMGQRAIALKVGISKPAVQWHLKQAGVAIRTAEAGRRLKWPVRETAFDAPLGEEASWVIGFLMADGCVTGKRQNIISVTVSATDAAILERIRAFLGTSNPVGVYQPNSKAKANGTRPRAMLTVHSSRLAIALASFGVIPRKSHVANALNGINTNVHFWRGVCDGDGSVMMMNGRTGPMPAIALCGALRLVQQFRDFVRSVAPECRSEPRPSKGIWHLVVNGTHAVRLAASLYGNCTIALPRKLKRAHQVMAWLPKLVRHYRS